MGQSKTCPRKDANFVSKLLFWWMTPLVFRGYKRDLTRDDIYDPLSPELSLELTERLTRAWKNGKGNLWKTLFSVFGFKYAAIGLLVALEELGVQLAQPILLGQTIRRIEAGAYDTEMYLCMAGVVSCSVLYPLLHHTYFFNIQRQGMHLRTACSGLIYEKLLYSTKNSDSTEILTLLSNDVSRLDSVLGHIHFLWIAPIQLCGVLIILWGYFEYWSLLGASLLLLSAPFQGIMGHLFAKMRKKTAIRSESRINLIKQMIDGMYSVKANQWESLLIKLANIARELELKWIKRTSNLRALNATLHHVSSKIIIFATLLAYVLTGNIITPEKVFVTIALYNNVKQVLTFFVPLGVLQISETLVSLKRIEKFLKTGNVKATHIKISQESGKPKDNQSIIITNLTINPSETFTLKNISLELQNGDHLFIIGPTGSGKSTFVNAILGNLVLSEGSIDLGSHKLIAYMPQKPWLFPGTIEENILFGSPMKLDWFDNVVDACALRRDLDSFPEGRLKVIGDSGGLSGGQRARISLARAIYSNADLTILEDPLSAVDSNVARQIMENCIYSLMKGKTLIMSTHHVELLSSESKVMVLKGGRMTSLSPKSLIDSLILTEGKEMRPETVLITHDKAADNASNNSSSSEAKIMEEETVYRNMSNLSLYAKYFNSGSGIFGLIFLLLVTSLTQFLYSGSDYWLQLWTKAETNQFVNHVFGDRQNYLNVFTVLFILLLLTSLIRTSFYFHVCMKASATLHRKLLETVLHAKMAVFDKTDSGEFLNVFSKDIGNIDDLLPVTMYESLEAAFSVVGVLVLVSVVNPVLLAPSAVVIILLVFIGNFYLPAARAIKRIEGIEKGVLTSHVASTLNGILTIKAFKAEQKLIEKYHTLHNFHSGAWFLVISCTRWLAFTVECVSITFIFIVAGSFLLFVNDGAAAGLAISSALTLTGMFQWGVRQFAETGSQLISVERVKNYSSLDTELDLVPQSDWPGKGNGSVEFKRVGLKYSGDKMILNDLSFEIQAGESIGVVGRTGAGKSSLISCLLRFVEVSSGSIIIDGVDTKNLSLSMLRDAISIIPQESFLLEGSLRFNLDPIEVYTDDRIWEVLGKVHLKDEFSKKGGLDFHIESGGSNLSIGERQLICLGRCLLKPSKILVLDEATSSIDKETDALLRSTIHEECSNRTIICIAHRMESVLDFDKVLVLRDGCIVEYDSPRNLLKNLDSEFCRLMRKNVG